MFRKTITGSLVAASLTAGALMTITSASATPTWLASDNISHSGLLPTSADVAMSENGTSVASWVRNVNGVDRIQASFFTGGAAGSWTFPATLTDPADVVSDANVAINDHGEAVVTWLEEDLSGDLRVAASRYLGQGDFDGKSFISTDNQLSAQGDYDVAMTGNGKVFVAHRDSDGGAINRVRVSTWTQAGVNASVAFSDDDAFAPSIAVNDGGDALLAWRDQENGPDTIQARRFFAANSSWVFLDEPSLPGTFSANQVETAISDNGSATIAYSKQDGDGDYRATANKVNASAFIGSPVTISPAGKTAGALSLSQNDDGTAFLAWNETGGGNYVGYASRPMTSGWSNAAKLDDALASGTTPRAAISDSGMTFIAYTDNGHLQAAYRLTPGGALATFDSGAQNFVDDSAQGGVDNQGNALLGGTMKSGDPGEGALLGAFLDTAGPVSTMTAVGTGANTYAKKFDVSWSATDRFSGLGTGNVRVRTAAWNGTFGSYSYPFVNTSVKTLSFTGAPGRTYCFEAQARDSHANLGKYSAPKCTTTPVDDRALVIAKGFKRAKAGSSYLGTYTIAKKKNAVMSLQHVKASKIAILVTKVAKGGKIQVSFAGQKLGTYSLKGTGNKVLIGAKSFGSVKSGTLVIKVVSKTGKVVRIDGVVVNAG